MKIRFRKLRTNLRRALVLALLILGTPVWTSIITGTAILFAGQIIHFISAGYLIKKDELITAGPYKHVRNPFYVGSFLTDCGLCIMAYNPYIPLIWFPLFYYLVIYGRTLREEEFLMENFGIRYVEYCKKVPRFLPNISVNTGTEPVTGEFSYQQLLRHREIPRVAKALALTPVFALKMNLLNADFSPGTMAANKENYGLIAIILLLAIVPGLVFIKKPRP
ncbi:MAG: isoprenylcysteine carboxylmethyltransferase family protein [Planctomycetes bacterium]|nr:isoprenylcysteine carboxylmethyltransferase family protein [Planctomycetota bacterium]